MKQTSNAIKFLMAQYRAIFKHAYLKGMASAVILTAGLTAGAANATPSETDPVYKIDVGSSSGSITIESGSIIDGSTAAVSGSIAGIASNSNTDSYKAGIAGNLVSGGTLLISSGSNGDFKGTIQKNVYGGFISKTTGDVFATSNEVLAKDSLTLGSGTASSAYGAYAVANSGRAFADNNKLSIHTYLSNAVTSGTHFLMGARAMGTQGAVANQNTVEILGDSNTVIIIDKLSQFVGGYATDQVKSGTTVPTGDYRATGNKAVLEHVKYDSKSAAQDLQIVGGRAFVNTANSKVSSLTSVDNSVSIKDSEFTISGASFAPISHGIIGNIAVANNLDSSASANVVASGKSGGQVSLELTNTTINNTNTKKTKFSVGGAFANTASGSATADSNAVKLSNASLTNVSLFGGQAVASGSSANPTANSNSITIEKGTAQVGNLPTITNSTINSGLLKLGGTAAATNKLIANSNTVTIGEGITLSDTIVNGVEIIVNTTDSSIITAKDNAVVFDGKAKASNKQKMIYGVKITNSVSSSLSGANTHYANITGNSVTVGANAELEKYDIAAVYSSGAYALALNNDVTIKGKVKNGNIYGGAGADSVVSLENSGLLNYQSSTASNQHKIASDVVNLAGTVNISNNDEVSIYGYFTDGNAKKNNFNTNQTTIESSAKLYNAGTLNLFGETTVADGAELHAMTTGAHLVVNGDVGGNTIKDDLDPEKANVPLETVGGRGSLKISVASLNSYLTADDPVKSDLYVGTDKDFAGAVDVKSGGLIEFTDKSVVLSDFDFANSSTAGKIFVESDTNKGGSKFRGDTITIAHELASNSIAVKQNGGTLTGITAAGVKVQANTLNLGASTLKSDDSAKIKFAEAVAKNAINFQTTSDVVDGKDGFVLTTQVHGSNFMRTRDQVSARNYFTALDGKITGNLTVSDGGGLFIRDGYWTAQDSITLTSGGFVLVGHGSLHDGEYDLSKSSTIFRGSPDATLTLDRSLVFNLADTTTDAKFAVYGDQAGYYDLDSNKETLGDDRFVMGDLTKGITLKLDGNNQIKGKGTLEVKNSGVIKLAASDVNNILRQNKEVNSDHTKGIFFNAKDGGVFLVDGDVAADFADFNTTNTNGFKLEAGQYDGALVAKSLSVTHEHDGTTTDDTQYTKQILKLVGSVFVEDLTISDLQRTNGANKPGNSEYASQVIFANGSAYVSKSLTSNNHTLVLGNAGSGATIELYTNAVGDKGTVHVENIDMTESSLVSVLNGEWDASSTSFKLSSGASTLVVGGDRDEDINDQDTTAVFQANGVTLTADSAFVVEADGIASIKGFDGSGLNAVAARGATYSDAKGLIVAGELTIDGDTTAKLADDSADPALGIKFGTEGSILIENNGILKFSSQATNAAIFKDGSYSGTASIASGLQTGYTKIANEGGELHLGLASGTVFDGDAIKELKNSLFTASSMTNGVLNKGGILNIGDATFNGVKVTELVGPGLSGYTAKWEDLDDFSDIYGTDVTNNQLVQTNVSDIKPGDEVRGHWGSLSFAANTAAGQQVDLVGDTSLRFAAGNNGFFISDANHSNALGATIDSQKSLTLIDGGKIGKISLRNGLDTHDKNVTTLEITGAGTTYVESIAAASTGENTFVKVGAATEVAGDITDIDSVEVSASVTAANAKVNNLTNLNGKTSIAKRLTTNEIFVAGGLVEAQDIHYGFDFNNSRSSDPIQIVNEGLVKAETLTVDQNYGDNIYVGTDDVKGLEAAGLSTNGTGYLEVGTLELNGRRLVVDPAYGSKASVSSVMKFKNGNEVYDFNDVGTLHGDLLIGKNAIQAIGATKDEALKDLANYLGSNGSLDEDKIGSALYLNGQLTIREDSEIALNAHHTGDEETIRDSLKYTIKDQALDQYADLGLGTNTAIFMTEKAFEDAKAMRTGTAIYFDRDTAIVNGQGGEIILAGDFDAASKLNIFNDRQNNGVDVEGSINVRTQNGFLYAVLAGKDQGYGVTLKVDKENAYANMYEASTPVVDTLISYHTDRIVDNGQDQTPPANNGGFTEIEAPKDSPSVTPHLAERGGANVDVGDGSGNQGNQGDNGSETTPTPQPPVAQTKVTGSSSFLNDVVNNTHGAPAEAAARLAVYGGAVQAALAANNANSDAIAARMGMGVGSEIPSMASNGQGGTLWVTPIYKTQESDSFGAQGLNYGVDLNLYGLALGGDITLKNGLRLGAMFNVGSGDADGQGNTAAANTSNDFDYYGFAVYGGYSYDAFTVSADLGYTVVDSDLESKVQGMTTVSKLTASTDTSALTFGVTGKYAFNFDGLELAPHAGLRYTRYDLDSYNVKGVEDVAHFDGDTINVFSIPVGVTVAKEFQGEEWTIKPSMDLTLTANFGDDEIKGDVTWTGVENLNTRTTSEFMDSFTYGVSAGVSAQTGAFVMGVGLNYTGSSNVDEFGINANARFLF